MEKVKIAKKSKKVKFFLKKSKKLDYKAKRMENG